MPSDNQANVPTAAMLAGDFTKVRISGLRARERLCARQRPRRSEHYRIRRRRQRQPEPDRSGVVQSGGLNLVKRLPKPQDDCGFVVYGSPFKQNEKQTIGKVDYQLNEKHSIMGRVMFTTLDKPVPYELSPDNLLTVSTGGRTEMTSSYSIGDTWLVSPVTVASTRLAANYTR